ncbi:hypothetical protein [Burkholderia cenocepacia]|uniref:hypothetical protein n=1 Tax=Burkholderia cenocepacia TaxID=95486 RepID=UPI00114CCD76|nr:hypothetical protein [Burkholderia cenocepacia]
MLIEYSRKGWGLANDGISVRNVMPHQRTEVVTLERVKTDPDAGQFAVVSVVVYQATADGNEPEQELFAAKISAVDPIAGATRYKLTSRPKGAVAWTTSLTLPGLARFQVGQNVWLTYKARQWNEVDQLRPSPSAAPVGMVLDAHCHE